jgi:hypothetical protein
VKSEGLFVFLLQLHFQFYSKEKIVSFYEELGHDMRERRKYLDSAVIFGELVNKPEERFLSLCKAKAWDEALRVQSMHEVPGSGMYFQADFKLRENKSKKLCRAAIQGPKYFFSLAPNSCNVEMQR